MNASLKIIQNNKFIEMKIQLLKNWKLIHFMSQGDLQKVRWIKSWKAQFLFGVQHKNFRDPIECFEILKGQMVTFSKL